MQSLRNVVRSSVFTAVFLFGACVHAAESNAAAADAALADVAHAWASANYAPGGGSADLLNRALADAQRVASAYPDRAEPRVWEAIVLASLARVEGGLGALGKVKRSRDLLLEAEKIDPVVMHGSIYTTLGSLYAKVPGWPIGFGDKKIARTCLDKALQIDPDGIDANYFYADFLAGNHEYAQASRYLDRALKAPPRPGREDADAGRRSEAEALLATIRRDHGDALAQRVARAGNSP